MDSPSPSSQAATVSLRPALPIYICTILSAVCRGTMFLLIPINALELGGLFGGFAVPGMLAVGAAITGVPAGMAASRFGHKPIMVVGLALAALGAVALAMTSSLVLMGLAAFSFGIGNGIWTLGRLTYMSDAFPIESRGRAVSTLGGMFRIGMFVGPALGGFGAVSIGREPTLLAMAGVLAVCCLLIARALPHTATTPGEPTRNPYRVVTRVISKHRHTFATVSVAMWALSLVRNGRMLLIPICGTLMGLEASETGLIKSVGAFADMLLFYPAGLLMDRRGRKWTAVPCLLTISIGVLLVGSADSYAGLLLGAIVAGLGNGMGTGINMTLAADFSPREGRADFIGVWRLISGTGSAMSPFIMGSVAQALSLGAAASVSCGIGFIGGAIMLLAVREPLARARSQAPAPDE